MIDRSPKVDHLAIQLHVHLVEVPAPVMEPAHTRDTLPAYVACEHRPEPVPPHPQRLMTDVDTAPEQQVFDVPER
jgi:hypothetical protein